MNVDIGIRMREQEELMTIKSLTFGMRQRDIAETRKVQGRCNRWVDVGRNMDNISPVYNLTSFCDRLIFSVLSFCDRLIGSVQVSCTYRKYINEL